MLWILLLFSPINTEPTDSACLDQAKNLLKQTILVDGHIDLPYRLHDKWEDVSVKTASGHFDYPRAVEGGLSAPFMSIYIPAKLEKEGGSKKLADELIDMIEGITKSHPDKFALARSPDDIEKNFKAGLISLPMGMENGSPIESDLANIDYFYQRGIRYITLTHSKDNHICDSSYDTNHTWKGLSPFGKEVVKKMNYTGIMIDVAHLSDDSFYQVMEISEVPVIASHSSCRHFVPGFERNMDDKMIQLLAQKGGVIQINFGSFFLTVKSNQYGGKRWKATADFMEKHELNGSHPKVVAFQEAYTKDKPVPQTLVQDVVNHIDHVVKLVGIDHVGLGSDYDGVGSLPTGLEDVSGYPNLIAALLCKGYSEDDIKKLCSENVFRVWRQVEAFSKAH